MCYVYQSGETDKLRCGVDRSITIIGEYMGFLTHDQLKNAFSLRQNTRYVSMF